MWTKTAHDRALFRFVSWRSTGQGTRQMWASAGHTFLQSNPQQAVGYLSTGPGTENPPVGLGTDLLVPADI